MKNKTLLKQWIHRIGRANLPLNTSTRICSRHFVRSEGRKLYQDEVASENLPVLSTKVTPNTKRKSPRVCRPLDECIQMPKETSIFRDQAVNTDLEYDVDLKTLTGKVGKLESELKQTRNDLDKQKFRL